MGWLEQKGSPGPKNYVRLAEGTDPARIVRAINDAMSRALPAEAIERISLHLQPMSRAHLYGEQDLGAPGSAPVAYVQILVAITLVIVAVASVNFVNLSAARTLAREGEIAVRKAMGAGRLDIFLQSLMESMLVTLLTLVIGFGVALGLPFDEIFGDALRLSSLGDWRMLGGMGAITLVVALAAGVYPAVVASRAKPTGSMGKSSSRARGRRTRNLLVVGQLGCAVFFIVSAHIVREQTDMMQTADVGFDKERIVTTRYIFIDDSVDLLGQLWTRPQPVVGGAPRTHNM